MSWADKIYNYCERGQSGQFWAEPLNAWSNTAFVIAALLALREFLSQPPGERGVAEAGLITLVATIGVGSFLFHTYATRWAVLTDTVPIGTFMLAYFFYALRRYLGLGWVLALIGLAAFFMSLRYAGSIPCRSDFLPITAQAGKRCFNGTLEYAPAFVALAGLAVLLAILRRPAWRPHAVAAVVFLVAMTFRTLDLELCDATRVAGGPLGLHFLWHLLNALTLYLLLRAALRYGRVETVE